MRVVLAIVHIAEIDLILAREEELVRRGKDRQRPLRRIQNLQAVPRPQIHRLRVRRSAKLVLLPVLRRVAPDQLRILANRKALQPGLVDVCHRRLLGAGNRLLPQQVRAFIGGELEIAGKDPQRQAVEGYTHPVAVRDYLARVRVVADLRPANLARVPRRSLHTVAARHHQRSVPEGVPLSLVLSLRRVDAQLLHHPHLRRRDAALSGGHLKVRRQVPAQNVPRSAADPRRQLLHYRLAILQRELRRQLLPLLALPDKSDGIAFHLRPNSGNSLIPIHIALQALGRHHSREQTQT